MSEVLDDGNILLTFRQDKYPSLVPELKTLFIEKFILNEEEIRTMILKSKSIQKDSSLNVNINGYVSGESKNIPDQFFASLANEDLRSSLYFLDCSIRIENVHLFSEKTQSFAKDFYKKYKIPISINMYISPSSETPCFKSHGDITDIFIYQIFGKKEWSFYQNENNEFIFNENGPAEVDQKRLKEWIKKTIPLAHGDILHLPPLLVHDAKCNDGPSIHLTISLNWLRPDQLLRIFEGIFLEEIKMNKFENLNNEEFENMFQLLTQMFNSETHMKKIIKEKERLTMLAMPRILGKGR